MASPVLASESHEKITGEKSPSKIRKVKETFTICAFCGCGIILYSTTTTKLPAAKEIPITRLMKDPSAPKVMPLSIPIKQLKRVGTALLINCG